MADNHQDSRFLETGPASKAVDPDRQVRVLIAEDDDEMRRLLAKVLRADGYATVECRDGADLFRHLEPFVVGTALWDFDVIVSDVLMPGPTGLEILEDLHECAGFPPVILITAFGDPGLHVRASKAGAVAVLDKPFGTEELLSKLHEIVPRRLPWNGGTSAG
jgi:CheY-like chemotaxis protein